MDIQINAAASVAGTGRAAAKGGEADAQASEASRRQATSETPAGKQPETSAVDAGEQTGDRDGNGQQVLDVFERSKRGDQQDPQESQQNDNPEESNDSLEDGNSILESPDRDRPGHHLDLEA